jgi:hypothetical protein
LAASVPGRRSVLCRAFKTIVAFDLPYLWLSASATHTLKPRDLVFPPDSPWAPTEPYDCVHWRVPGTADRETCAAGGTDDAR